MTICLGTNVINVAYTKSIGKNSVFYCIIRLLYLRGTVT